MTKVTPTLQKTSAPRLRDVIDALQREAMKEMNCARPGVIQSFEAADMTATVKIAQQQVTSIDPQGVKTLAEYPLLLKVPVFFASGGGFTATFPIAAGDECLIIFCDREIDNWFISGQGKPPTVGRVHDLSDGMCFVGFRSAPRALADFNTTAAELRSDDGETIVQVGPGKVRLVADEVNLHARDKITFDANGTGFVYYPDHIERYEDGVPVNTHPPNPPEVP